MTSKISLNKITGEIMRHHIWVIIVTAVVGFLTYPMLLHFRNTEEFDYSFSIVLSMYNYWTYIFLTIMAVISAASVFWYLHSRGKSDFFLSLGAKRGRLFTAGWISGLLAVAIPFTANFMLSIFVILPVHGLFTTQNVCDALASYGLFILGFAAIYSACVLAMQLTGRLLLGIVTMMFILCFVPLCNILLNYLIEDNYAHLVTDWTSGAAYNGVWFSPLGSLIRSGVHYLQNDNAGYLTAGIIIMAVWVVGAFAAGIFVNKIRKAETAGCAMAFRWMKPVVKICVGVLAALMIGSLFNDGSDSSSYASAAFWIGAIVTIVIVQVIAEFIYSTDVKEILRRWKSFLIMVGCLIAAGILIFADPFGIDRWFPKKENVAEISVKFEQLNTHYMEHYFGDFPVKGDAYQKLEDFEPVYDMLESCWNGVDSDGLSTNMIFGMHLKNGSVKYRWYNADHEKMKKILEDYSEDVKFREKFYPVFNADFSNLNYFELSKFKDAEEENKSPGMYQGYRVSEETCAEIIAIYANEVKNFSLKELESSKPVYSLYMRTNYNEYDYYNSTYTGTKAPDYSKSFNSTTIYIYPQFEKTIEALKNIMKPGEGEIQE